MLFKVTARHGDQNWDFQIAYSGLSLLEELQRREIPIKSSCMGKGICRQCRVHVDRGIAPAMVADRKVFSQSQLADGWRLSCCLRPRTSIEVTFPQGFVFQNHLEKYREPKGPWWIACDFGTTGIEMSGVDADGVWANVKGLNRQVSMGPDVMTRLEFAQRNGVSPLYEKASKQITFLCDQLIKAADNQSQFFTRRLWFSGNSAVTAFLARQNIESLACAPYAPASLAAQNLDLDDLRVTTLPLLHSFVGGDLFAGLFLLWSENEIQDLPWILMDVGTNSEILFWDGERLLVSSTPAGPAFEGSSISIGMRAENGAIVHPKREPDRWKFKVVGDDLPKGICGSGLIEMVDEAVEMQIVSEDGEVLRTADLCLTPNLTLTQDDIREFQLAKSAIQTGLEIVSGEGRVRPQKLFLAGSFGENLNLPACQRLGLLPEIPTKALGNSSLRGAILWGTAEEGERHKFQSWLEKVKKPIELALSDRFQEAFVRNMTLRWRKS